MLQLLVSIALTLNGANLYGYYKCKVGSSESFTTLTSNFFRKQLIENAVKIVTSQTATPSTNNPNIPTHNI